MTSNNEIQPVEYERNKRVCELPGYNWDIDGN